VRPIIYSRRNVKGAKRRLFKLFLKRNPYPSRGKLTAFTHFMKRVIPPELGETRNETASTYLDKDLKEALMETARRHGVSVSEYLRNLILRDLE
jgi:hypothetical protein